MRMAGSEGSVGRGVTGEWPPVARDPMRRVLDALESSYLDDERSDQLFEQLMARLAEEEARKRKAARWFRWIGMASWGRPSSASARPWRGPLAELAQLFCSTARIWPAWSGGARRGAQLADDAAGGGGDADLGLHRLDDGHRVALARPGRRGRAGRATGCRPPGCVTATQPGGRVAAAGGGSSGVGRGLAATRS